MKGILLFLFFSFGFLSAQNSEDTNSFEIDFLAGNILNHAPDISHLITGHPDGIFATFSKKTHGNKPWQKLYNYPDYGFYFLYQDFKNEFLGSNYALGAHYNFYFLKRNLNFRFASGIAYTTNPHNNVTNSKNGAFGSKLMGNMNMFLNYKKENIIDNIGFQVGIAFTHFSNGRIKSPNSGINTYGINLGLNYNFEEKNRINSDTTSLSLKFKEPIKFNFVLRTGINESPIIGSGQHAFYHVSIYADKRVDRKSAIQFGTELFLSNFYKDFIKYQSVAYPNKNLDPNTDYKRVGVFVGHELFINRISLETQIGYYIYQPYKFDIPFYDRIGMKYYFGNKVFTGISLKTHAFLAESMELVLGIRL
jgi:hypothetical protein